MRYRQIDLNLLLVFHEVMQNGSVVRAARNLGVSQGAVSQSLGKLRKHFGDELFIKTNTGVAPTEMALSLAEDVRQSIAFAETALLGRADFRPQDATREIKICMGDLGELNLVPRMMEAFGKIAPKCRITVLDLWGDELTEGFERGEVDVALNARGPPLGDFLQQKLYEDAYMILTSQESPLEDEIDAKELSALPHVVVSPGRLGRFHLEDELVESGIRRNVVLRIANWATVPHILQARPGLVALIPGNLVPVSKRFALKVVKPSFELPKIEIFQFWHRRATTDPYNVWLRTQLKAMFGK